VLFAVWSEMMGDVDARWSRMVEEIVFAARSPLASSSAPVWRISPLGAWFMFRAYAQGPLHPS
jgi:hypothetical protein